MAGAAGCARPGRPLPRPTSHGTIGGMCGRFTLTHPTEAMAQLFGAAPGNDLPEGSRFNICPTQAMLLFLLALRRSGERAGRMAKRLGTTEKANDVQRLMMEAAARRPRDRDELAQRLRDGRF